MTSACTPVLVGVTPPVLEIWLPFKKRAKFSFLTIDYSPWSWRKLIDRNWLKKFMQVRVDIECMRTDFGGRGLFGFRDKISLLSIIGKKILIDRNQLKTFMQVGVDVKFMYARFGGRGLSGFGDMATFQKRQIYLSDHGL